MAVHGGGGVTETRVSEIAAAATSAVTKSSLGLGSVDNTADTAKPVSTAQQTALDLKANLASPTFTGTVSGITAAMVGLGNVENKSSATIRSEITSSNVTTALTYTPTSVTGLTGTQSVAAFKTGLTLVKGDVGLGSVDNTTDAGKPVSTAQQTALDLKAPLLNPVLTGMSYFQQGAPTARNSTTTLTIADLLTAIITSTSSSAVSLTLPTGANADAGILAGALAADRMFEWVIVNLGSSSGAVTVLAGTNHTIVGNAVVAISTSARFWSRKTATNTFITYRVG